jgi:hypothetical protein
MALQVLETFLGTPWFYIALLEKCNPCIATEFSVWMACMHGWTNKLRCVTNGNSSVTDDWEQLGFQRGGMRECGTDNTIQREAEGRGIRKVVTLNRIFGEPGKIAPVVDP